jgi:colicin import membrane protein/protein TonB
MALPVVTALGRRDRMWPAVTVSAVLHAALVAWAVVHPPPAPIDLEQKAIVAKLVRIGEKRPEEWLPRRPAEPPPAVAPPAPAAPAPVATASPAPTPAPAAPTPAAPRAPAPPGAKPGPAPRPGTTLASVLSQVRKEQETVYGSPDGDPAGFSEDGSEGDAYVALVQSALAANYVVPSTIPEKERLYLKAVVVLYIEADGRVRRLEFGARSGNPVFDGSCESTFLRTKLPPPPDALRDTYRRTGLQVTCQATRS